MNKFTKTFKFPCNSHSNSPKAEVWRSATTESNPELFGVTLVCITEDGRVFQKLPKHYTGVIHQRASGGKWEEITVWINREKANKDRYFCNLVSADFKGQPRIKKNA